MDRYDLSIELAISLLPRVSVNKNKVHSNKWVWRGGGGGNFCELCFNEAYNYDLIDMRFFSCMSPLAIRILFCMSLYS